MRTQSRVIGTLSILVPLAGSCGGEAGREPDGPVVTVVDGVTSVVMPPLDATTGPAWRLTALFSTADAATRVDLHQATDAVFTEDGSLAIANSGNREILVLDADGAERSRFGRQGDGPGEFNWISWLEAGEDGGIIAYTLTMLPAKEWAYIPIPDGAARTEVGFGRDLATAGRSGRSALGATDSLAITVFDATGEPVMRVSGGGSAVPVSSADLEAFRQQTRDRLAQADEARRRAFEDHSPARETYPGFEHLLIDDAGRLWIGAYARPGRTMRRWVVLDSDGTVAGTLETPADATLLDAAGDRLAMLQRTDLDEEYIAVFRIEPGE
jgi:hypothetical protein